MSVVDAVHIGPQKAATTWLYRAFREHPEIACAPRDAIHYFDMFYQRGRAWYGGRFEGSLEHQVRVDFTPTYIRSPWAAERIASENPDALLILCLRHPVDRAFSHYWHEKKKGTITFAFEDVLTNYDLFSSWIEPGFYARHLERYLRHFDTSQILAQSYEMLRDDPQGFLGEALAFVGVDPAFEPSILHDRVNPAGAKRDVWNLGKAGLNRIGNAAMPNAWKRFGLDRRMSGREEYLRGMDDGVRSELLEILSPETDRLESMIGIDLSSWRK